MNNIININIMETPYLISNEHYLQILMEYLPREFYSIVRLTSKSFNRIITAFINIDNNNDKELITGYQLVRYLIKSEMITLLHFVMRPQLKHLAYGGRLDYLNHLRGEGSPCNPVAMRIAAKRGQLHIMRYLHEEIRCEWPSNICFYSAKGGNVDCLNYSHRHGCRYRYSITSCAKAGIEKDGIYSFPLFAAAQKGHLRMVCELLNRGADVNAVVAIGWNSLMVASQEGHVEVVRELLDRGADVNVVDIEGWNSLMAASLRGHVEVVRELLNRGADIDVANENGNNSLIIASAHHIEVVRELLNRGANIHARANDGLNPLMFASENGNIDVVRELLNRGADVDARSIDGKTAKSLVSRHDQILRVLESMSKK